MKKKNSLTYGEYKDKVNVDYLKSRSKVHQSQPASSSPQPMRQQPKQEPSATTKIIEAGADMVEGLGNALSGIFQAGPANDPEEEEFIRKMKRRPKRKRGRSL